ncbi:VanW family protein [Polycladomyces zharkentensis]
MEEKKEPTVGDSRETPNESPSLRNVPDSRPEADRLTEVGADASDTVERQEKDVPSRKSEAEPPTGEKTMSAFGESSAGQQGGSPVDRQGERKENSTDPKPKVDESIPVWTEMSEETESKDRKTSTEPAVTGSSNAPSSPEREEMAAAALVSGTPRMSVWDRVTRVLQRVPLVNRIPFQRIGPQKTVVGALVVAFALVGSLSAFVFDGTTDAKEAPRAGVTKPHQQPYVKPKPIPFIVTHEGRKWTVDLRTLGYDGQDPSTLNRDKWLAWFRGVKKEVDQPAVDAEQNWFGGKLTPSKTGKLVDMDTIEKEWLPRLTTMTGQPQELPMVIDQPEVTEADFQQVDQRLIGKYTTYFDGSNVNRTTNIRLASKAINNLILSPGERFSFNRVVGPRTPGRGYKSAKVIVRGEYSEGIGGGICQVSSTLFNSVDEAGLRILQRNSHSKEVAYVPPGRDATVSWGGPDFRFKNNLTKPVLIRIRVTSNAITAYVYTTPDARVKKRKPVQPAPTKVESVPATNPGSLNGKQPQ